MSRNACEQQLALTTNEADVGHNRAASPPAPRGPLRDLRVAPELGAPGRELDTWRLSGHQARVLTPFSATACTGNAGLCGVCTGGPCQHDLEHQQHDHEHQQREHGEDEREIEDEEIEP